MGPTITPTNHNVVPQADNSQVSLNEHHQILLIFLRNKSLLLILIAKELPIMLSSHDGHNSVWS